MPPCLILNFIRYGSRVNGAIQGKDLCTPLHFGIAAIEKGASGSLWSARVFT